MYQIEKTKDYYLDNPWDKPYSERVANVKKAKAQGRKVVAYIYPVFDSSTFRYRGYNVSETLEYSLYWYGVCFQYSEFGKLSDDIALADVIVFIRCHCNPELVSFLDACKKYGKKTCYDIDDLIYSPKHLPHVISSLNLKEDHEWNFWFGLSQRYHEVASACDAFITTNQFLADYIIRDFDKPCYIIKNYLNWYQEKISEEYFEKKQKLESQQPFQIGYFSGSPTHVKDLLLIMPELEEFLKAHKDAELKIVGYMTLPEKYNYLTEQGKIVYVPFQTFTGLQYEQAKVDINVVPLMDTVFANCKSELKYFENAIVGTVTCASPTYTYRNVITSGVNGYICGHGEWYPIFERIYQNGISKDEQKKMRNSALEEYSVKKQLDHVESVLNSIVML